jgi:Helicase HerA, central domain
MNFDFERHHTILGTVFTHAGEEELALCELDRMNHMLVIGKTGMGKTRSLKNIIIQDIHTGRGVGVIDPHGDLQNEILDELPRRRAGDLVYLNPDDQERVATFNVLENVPRDRIAPTTSEIVAACKAVWDSWGPRLERILYNAVAALIEADNTSLIGLPRLLKDERYRASVLEQVKDPIVHGFFVEEYATWDDDFRTTAIDPVLNKVEALLAAPVVRAILGTTKSSIDLSEVMDERKIFIANLAKGSLGPGHAHLLGAMLVSGFSNAAARRGATRAHAADQRIPFFLHVDEFENFATDAFGDILSEARKWKLGLVLAHQFLEQLPPKLRAAVLANVGTLVAFQLGGEDAEVIAREIGLRDGASLTQLARGEVWIKHATYGGPYHPRLLDPIVTRAKGREPALKQNRLRNTFPRARVEAKINRFLRPQQKRRPHLR